MKLSHKAFILFVLCALCVKSFSQDLITPPAEAEAPAASIIKPPDLDPQPMGDYTNVTWTWAASPSPFFDHYNFLMFPSLQSISMERAGLLPAAYATNGTLLGQTTNCFFTASITNTTAGFPGVQTADKFGLLSPIRL